VAVRKLPARGGDHVGGHVDGGHPLAHGDRPRRRTHRLKKLSKTIDGQFELTDFDEQERS